MSAQPGTRRKLTMPYTGSPTATRSKPRVPHKPAPGRTDGRGLDLAVHFHEVRACILGSYARRCRAAGVEADDLLSTVYTSILASNSGPAAYDPSRASVMRYVHLLTASRLSHLVESTRSRNRVEQVGIHAKGPDKHYRERDVGEILDEQEGVVGEDPEHAITRLLPGLVAMARKLDREAEDSPGAAFAAMFGTEDSTWQGWREHAIRWVVYENPNLNDVLAWWQVGVPEGSARMAWARARWAEAIGA